MIKKTFIVFFLCLLITGCKEELIKTTETKELLGTIVTITVMSYDEDKAKNSINLAFDEIERIDSLLSIYKNDSQVFLLNKNGFLNNASYELIYNLKKANYFSKLSNGAFDISVQPILELYTKSFSENKRPPTGQEINGTLRLVNYKNIIINKNNIEFKNKNMKITLGGIAKGYAVDKAIEVLEKNGIKNALVNAGGDIRTIGKKNKEDWTIALENPRNKEEYIAIINLNNKSIATSGDYERYFDEKKEFHHIVNPKTGYSATELISVTIIADKAIDADALSTSVFVLGMDDGLMLIERLRDVEGLIITNEKEIIKSSGFD